MPSPSCAPNDIAHGINSEIIILNKQHAEEKQNEVVFIRHFVVVALI